MACGNLIAHFVEQLAELAIGLFGPLEPRSAAPAGRPSRPGPPRGRAYHGPVRTLPAVEVFVRVTHCPSYYRSRSGLDPTRVLPASRIAPADNPALRLPLALPASANARARAALAPSDPDGGPSRPWPPADR